MNDFPPLHLPATVRDLATRAVDPYALRTGAALAQAYGESRDERTFVRGGGILGGIRDKAFFNKMNVLDSANPSTVNQIALPGSGNTETDAEVSAGNKKKVVCKFNRPWTVGSNDLLILPAATGNFRVNVTISWALFNWTLPYYVRGYVQLEYITADFDETTLSWSTSLSTVAGGGFLGGSAEILPGSYTGVYTGTTGTFPIIYYPPEIGQIVYPSPYLAAGTKVFGILCSAYAYQAGIRTGLTLNSIGGTVSLFVALPVPLAGGYINRAPKA